MENTVKPINIMYEFTLLFISIVILYFIYRAYTYLGNLDNCDCAPHKIVQNLKMIELYYLIIILGGILFNVLYLVFNINYTKLFTKSNYLVGLIAIYVLSVFAFYIYYVYNVIEYKRQLNPECKCANQWQNDIMYVHVLYLSLPLLLTVLSAMFNFQINTSVLTLVIVALAIIYYYESYIISQGKTTESMVSMLSNYSNMLFLPQMYSNRAIPFENDGNAQNPDFSNFAPHVGQPLQKYHQMRPDEYPAAPVTDKSLGLIYTPLSTHEAVVMEFRKKPPVMVNT